MNRLTAALCLGAVCAGCGLSLAATLPDSTRHQPECVHVFRGIRPWEVALSPCGRYLAAAGCQAGTDDANSLLLVWDLHTRKEVFRYGNANGGFNTVTFSPSGKQMAAGGSAVEKAAKVWDFPSGKEVARLANGENIQRLRYAPDGKSLAMATFLRKPSSDSVIPSSDGVIAWDVENWQKRFTLRGDKLIFSLTFSADGKCLACGDAAGLLWLWKFAAGEKSRQLSVDKGFVYGLGFARDGKRLVAGVGPSDLGGRVCLFSDPAKGEPPTTVLKAQEFGVFSLLLGPEDQLVFAGGAEPPPGKRFGTDGTVYVWDVAGNRLHARFKAHGGPVLTMALTRDGQTLITASRDETVKVWSLPKGFYAKKNRAP